MQIWVFLVGFVWFGLLFFTLCQHFNEECRYYHCLVPIKTERSYRFLNCAFWIQTVSRWTSQLESRRKRKERKEVLIAQNKRHLFKDESLWRFCKYFWKNKNIYANIDLPSVKRTFPETKVLFAKHRWFISLKEGPSIFKENTHFFWPNIILNYQCFSHNRQQKNFNPNICVNNELPVLSAYEI